jgi:threonine aldolase
MDGARFAQAVASLAVSPAEASWKSGVDVLCFGGTKMGLPVGEIVVFFDRTKSEDFAWRCKQAGQLASKMRFLAAPWLGVLDGDVWLRHARHANAMAKRLSDGLSNVAGIEAAFVTQANGVFLNIDDPIQQGLRSKGWQYYSFLAGCNARFMCAWDTRSETVDALIRDAEECSVR